MDNRAYLSLGSNIEPEVNLAAAVKLLAEQTRLKAVSSVWETLPLGPAGQPNYLNAAALVETALSAAALKEQVLKAIEQKLGRVRQGDKFGPRPIDLDIIFFNRDSLELGQRRIPDPEVLERAFVAIPLAEIDPGYIHPETGQSLADIAEGFKAALATMKPRPDLSQALTQWVSQA
jgi:2-amino-4-hydroxy-6-hydroxymethyldihydropteridine diphosphokinase